MEDTADRRLKMAGILYGVGVGPGDPELMCHIRVLFSCHIVSGMIPGHYHKRMQNNFFRKTLLLYHLHCITQIRLCLHRSNMHIYNELKIASTVLHEREDCGKMVLLLCEMLQFQHDYTYILMGHGTEDRANIRYHQMNEAFVQSGIVNVHIVFPQSSLS